MIYYSVEISNSIYIDEEILSEVILCNVGYSHIESYNYIYLPLLFWGGRLGIETNPNGS